MQPQKWWPPTVRRVGRRSKNDANQTGLQFEQLEPRLALTVVINEFLAENDTDIQDAAGHRHDWIELKNTGVMETDISGWYLTDNMGDLTKWQIPATAETTNFAAGDTLLIYASGANGEDGLVGTELHANFQISLEPGYLGLHDGSVAEVDKYDSYPQQLRDVSYGLGVGTQSTTTDTLLSGGTSSTGDGSPAQFRPFTGPNASVDDHWTEIDYVATGGDGWSGSTNGLGFGYSSPWQDSTVSLSGEQGAYVRLPFSVTNKAALTSLSLDLRVDNGYILFLNGREVQRERLATDHKIGNDWELNARQNLSNSTITGSPAQINLTPWLETIEEGDNVLAIYAANHNSDTGDFLVNADLTAQRAIGAVAETFMVSPTPGGANGAGYLGVIEDTVFSHDRGFYDAPFDLTITAVGPDSVVDSEATIMYTTDGSAPTLNNGLEYVGAITIDPLTLSNANAGVVTVRAAAFRDEYFSSNVDTQSYIFLDSVLQQDGIGLPPSSSWGYAGSDWDIDPSIVSAVGASNLKEGLKSIPTMSLVMDWEELFGDGSSGDGHGIYTQSEGWRDKSDERAASLEYFTDDLAEEFQIDAAVEIQGHSSAVRWRSDKLSFEIKFKQPYDTKLESDSLFGNSAIDGANAANSFDSLILDAQYNYTFAVNNTTTQGPYATFIHDQVVADLSNLAGGQAPHGRWVHLYINGMYWGVYNAHEKPTDSFAEEYNGGDKDDYLVVKGFDGIGLTHGGTQDKYIQADGGLASQLAYRDLLGEVDDNLSNLAEYQQVAAMLDVDSFINYIIVTYYAGNYDWGENNWYASFNSVDPDGRWRFHSWDQEHAFPNDQNKGAGDGRNQDYDHTALVTNDFGEHEFGPTGIHHELMGSEEYRLRFSDRVEELLKNDGLLTPANAQAVWQARIDEISGAINGEAARWGDNRNPAKDGNTWLTNVQYTADNFFFANGSYQSRTDEIIDIFNNTIGSGVGKTDWLANLDAPTFNQYGGDITAPFGLTLGNTNGAGTIYYTLDGTDPRDVGGVISSAAEEYTGDAITLMDSTRVRARVLDTAQSGIANDWSAEIDKTFNVDRPLSLRVVELMYHPADAGDLEYIELLNFGDSTIDLTGVQLADFSSGGHTFVGGSLAAGSRIVVAQDVAAFQSRYPGVTNVAATAFSGSLSNSGETVTLKDGFGVVLQSFAYSDDGLAGWATLPDDGGPSLEYIGPLDGTEDPLAGSAADPFDDPANWQASSADGGSPGSNGLTPSALPGDYNNDQIVNLADYTVWRDTLGSTTDLRANGDDTGASTNVIDAADYSFWKARVGNTSSTVAQMSVASTQPSVEAVSQSNSLAFASLAAPATTASGQRFTTPRATFFGKSRTDESLLLDRMPAHRDTYSEQRADEKLAPRIGADEPYRSAGEQWTDALDHVFEALADEPIS